MRAERRPVSRKRYAEHGFAGRGHYAKHGFVGRGRYAEHGFVGRGRYAEHGFTLIEIMVALAVFSLAVMALVRLESATVRGASILDETLVAQMVARNVAIEAVTDAIPPTAGSVTGAETNGGRAWTWSRQVTALGGSRVLRIDVSVADRTGTQLGRATMVRPAPRVAT